MKGKASLTVIFITIFIDLMGFGILMPILPTFASKYLSVSDFGIGVTVAAFSFMQFIFNPILGKLSDRIGRRPVMLATQSLTAISYLVFAYSNSFSLLLISRMMAGLGASNIGVAQAYIADITTREERAKGMGIIGAAFGLGFVFGPVIGAFLAKYGYTVAGIGAAIFSFTAWLFAFFKLPESLHEKKVGEKIRFKIFDISLVKSVVTNPTVGFLVILYFVIIFSIANIYGTYAILGYKHFHFSDQQNGMLFGISGLVGAIVQAGLVRAVSNKWSDRTIVLIGLVALIIGLGTIPYGTNFQGEAIVMIIMSIGTGILQPIIPSMVSKYSSSHEQGTILGVNQSLSALARVLGPLWGGFSFDFFGYQAPFLTGAIFAAIILFFTFFLLKPEKYKLSDV